MTASLKDGTIDVAIALTESLIAGIASMLLPPEPEQANDGIEGATHYNLVRFQSYAKKKKAKWKNR